jgi:hypothetical protein
MTAFALLTAAVFGTVAKDNNRDRLAYGVKVFFEFILIGLILGWILYFLPL